MKKLYPVHLITFIMSIALRWEWILKFEIIEIISKALRNLSLLQSLLKEQILPFNGLSWFLSTTFLLYIVAIPLIISIKKVNHINPYDLILSILILQKIVTFINNSQNYGLNLYTSPFFRVFDFMVGILIAKQFMDESKYKLYNLYEFGIVIIFFIMYILTLFYKYKLEYGLSYYSPKFCIRNIYNCT